MKFSKFIMFIVTISVGVTFVNAQSKKKSYSFKKGEVLDILILTTKPNTDSLFAEYRKIAFPYAIKRTYKGLPGFRIAENIQGNLEPKGFILSKWDDLQKREKFIEEIENFVPDFHQQRRDIWSIFNLTYYEMPEDTSFEINKEKFNVVTAYWGDNKISFKNFTEKWLYKSKENKGKTIITLINGKSPVGYYYQPDFMVITEWSDRETFEVFKKENLKMDHKGVKHVNQFIIN